MEMEISWQRNEQVRVRDRGGFLRYCLPGFKSLNGQKLGLRQVKIQIRIFVR